MTQPRRELIRTEVTPYYHVVSRCVRRQFLCGNDPLTGKDFSYRREWIQKRLHQLAGIFAINICAYAVMSNHFHGVLQIDQSRARAWPPEEVARRWVELYSGPDWLISAAKQSYWTKEDRAALALRVATYRQRLSSLSWFMRCLNEQIARRANKEDDVTGHFWQGRFKSQALLDQAALLSAMAYVELNPVRAGLVDCPEDCPYSSARLRAESACCPVPYELRTQSERILVPFLGECSPEYEPSSFVPAELNEYLSFLDWSGRLVKTSGAHQIPGSLPPILERLGLSEAGYASYIRQGGRPFYMLGHPSRLLELAGRFNKRRLKGNRFCATLYRLEPKKKSPPPPRNS